jgi:hypothetical protein
MMLKNPLMRTVHAGENRFVSEKGGWIMYLGTKKSELDLPFSETALQRLKAVDPHHLVAWQACISDLSSTYKPVQIYLLCAVLNVFLDMLEDAGNYFLSLYC